MPQIKRNSIDYFVTNTLTSKLLFLVHSEPGITRYDLFKWLYPKSKYSDLSGAFKKTINKLKNKGLIIETKEYAGGVKLRNREFSLENSNKSIDLPAPTLYTPDDSREKKKKLYPTYKWIEEKYSIDLNETQKSFITDGFKSKFFNIWNLVTADINKLQKDINLYKVYEKHVTNYVVIQIFYFVYFKENKNVVFLKFNNIGEKFYDFNPEEFPIDKRIKLFFDKYNIPYNIRMRDFFLMSNGEGSFISIADLLKLYRPIINKNAKSTIIEEFNPNLFLYNDILLGLCESYDAEKDDILRWYVNERKKTKN